MNFSRLKDFFEKFKRPIIYPQYSMFLIEIFYSLCLCYFTLRGTKSLWVKFVVIPITIIVVLLFYLKYKNKRELNYGTFRDQLNDTRKQGEKIRETNSRLRYFFIIIFNIISYVLFLGSVNKILNSRMFILDFFFLLYLNCY